MALSRRQDRMADLIYGIGRRRGLSHQDAVELALAAWHESRLNPKAQGPAVHHSGYGGARAAGLFQLLSSGYVQAANRRGGVFNPRANLLAILPAYLRYFRNNPNAEIGAAARDVEVSGMPASWYARDFDLIARAVRDAGRGGGGGRGGRPMRPTVQAPQQNLAALLAMLRPQVRATAQPFEYRSPQAVIGSLNSVQAPPVVSPSGSTAEDLYSQIGALRRRLLTA